MDETFQGGQSPEGKPEQGGKQIIPRITKEALATIISSVASPEQQTKTFERLREENPIFWKDISGAIMERFPEFSLSQKARVFSLCSIVYLAIEAQMQSNQMKEKLPQAPEIEEDKDE